MKFSKMKKQLFKPLETTPLNTYLLTKDLNSGDGGFPLISMSIPRARQVDSMILKQHWMVGSWLQSSKRRW